jgi:hypothetical protein
LIRGDAVKLSQAPKRFLGDAWARLVELTGDEVGALKALDHPEPGFTAFYRRMVLKSGSASPERRKESLVAEEIAALTGEIVAGLGDLGAKSRIVASGLFAGTGLRQAIPAELWPAAKFGFAAQTVTSGVFAYHNVTVEPGVQSADVENTVARIRTWLEKRRDERGEETKKALRWPAQQEFGEAFTVRAFKDAYAATYGRVRGRPKKKN